VTDVPVEGTTYSVGNTIGSSTVACVVASPGTSCVDTGLANGTAYHYKIFTKDTRGNYSSAGAVPTGSPATPVADPIAPADTIDLIVTASTSSAITLSWTAPGDDGTSGTATTYDVRYSTSPITSGNWGSATQATGEPSPSAAGTAETFQATGLSGSTTYYFALKTLDESSNSSGLSNNAVGTTQASGTTLTLHPSGANASDNASYTSSAATDLDTNDGSTTRGTSSGSFNDLWLDIDDTALTGTITSVQVKAVAARGGSTRRASGSGSGPTAPPTTTRATPRRRRATAPSPEPSTPRTPRPAAPGPGRRSTTSSRPSITPTATSCG